MKPILICLTYASAKQIGQGLGMYWYILLYTTYRCYKLLKTSPYLAPVQSVLLMNFTQMMNQIQIGIMKMKHGKQSVSLMLQHYQRSMNAFLMPPYPVG